MNSSTKSTLACASLLVLFSPASQATTDKYAMQNCAEALRQKVESDQGQAVDMTLGGSIATSNRYISTNAVYHLTAIDPKTDEPVAKLDCYVDRRGKIMRLKTVPVAVIPEESTGEVPLLMSANIAQYTFQQ